MRTGIACLCALLLAACSPARPGVDANPPDVAADVQAMDLVSIDDATDDTVDDNSPDGEHGDIGPRDVAPESSSCGDTQSDVNNCGACGRTCASLHVLDAVCVGGICGGHCDPAYRDCDGDLSNGCEVHAAVDVMNCGGCHRVCDGGACAGGFCG